MPENEVDWMVTPSGTLKISWLKKIAEYKDNDQVNLIFKAKNANETIKVEGIAKEVKVDSLRFADDYDVVLQDKLSGVENYTFSFTACNIKIHKILKYFVLI